MRGRERFEPRGDEGAVRTDARRAAAAARRGGRASGVAPLGRRRTMRSRRAREGRERRIAAPTVERAELHAGRRLDDRLGLGVEVEGAVLAVARAQLLARERERAADALAHEHRLGRRGDEDLAVLERVHLHLVCVVEHHHLCRARSPTRKPRRRRAAAERGARRARSITRSRSRSRRRPRAQRSRSRDRRAQDDDGDAQLRAPRGGGRVVARKSTIEVRASDSRTAQP